MGWEKIVAREDIADHLENHNLVAAERRALGDVEKVLQPFHMVAGTRRKPHWSARQHMALAVVEKEATQLATRRSAST